MKRKDSSSGSLHLSGGDFLNHLSPAEANPVVAIIGRANVGKSTLFNRIIRRREAIVDDAPGITRDRKAADAEWQGRAFTLVDTGGYIPKGKDSIETGIARQVRMAIAEADLILFLCDVKSGISDVDGEIGRILRKSGKPCIVAVNKVDNEKREPDAAEFIQLGLGEPSGISAAAGLGIGDLLDRIVGMFAVSTMNTPAPLDAGPPRLAVVGRPNVGKSTFVNVVLGKDRLLVSEIPGTTRDAVDVRIRWKRHEMILIDTAGMRRQSHVDDGVEYYSVLRTQRVLGECDVACVLADASEGLTQQDLQVVRQAVQQRKAVVLAMNKWDLVEKDAEKKTMLLDGMDLKLQGFEYIPVVFTACINGLRAGKVLDEAWKAAQERKKRIPSPELNRFLKALNAKTQPPAVQGKRVSIPYATQASADPPVFAFFSNYPELIPESYKKFLENKIRETFGFRGVPLTFSFRKK
jgi:GTP-binding protein